MRIRAKILTHDGVAQKPRLWEAIGKSNALVNRIVEGKDAFIMITDCTQMEVLLRPDNKEIFKRHGFDLLTPIEYNTERTILVKGIDSHMSNMTEDQLKSSIKINNEKKKVNKIIKIPNNSRCLRSPL